MVFCTFVSLGENDDGGDSVLGWSLAVWAVYSLEEECFMITGLVLGCMEYSTGIRIDNGGMEKEMKYPVQKSEIDTPEMRRLLVLQ